MRFAISILAAVALFSCSGVNQFLRARGNNGAAAFNVDPPTASVNGAVLAAHPSEMQVAGYLCPEVLPGMACRIGLGARPALNDLTFAFDIEVDVMNPNDFPIPMVELAASFTAYPDLRDAKNLGTVCLKFCEEGASCQADGGRCENGDELRSAEDYANAAANFLIGVAVGANGVDNLRVRMLEAKTSTRVVVRFELNPEQMLGLIELGANDLVQKAVSGQGVRVAIPFSIQGTAYLNVENFGRIAVDVPAFRSEWEL